MLTPGRKLGVLRGNPLNDDALEFARAVGLHWLMDIVLNPDDSYAAIYCSDMEKAHTAACADAAKIYTHPVRRNADIVIVYAAVNGGGIRQALNFYRSLLGGIPT